MYLLPGAVALAGNDIVQRLQRRILLSHLQQLIGALESALRLQEMPPRAYKARHADALAACSPTTVVVEQQLYAQGMPALLLVTGLAKQTCMQIGLPVPWRRDLMANLCWQLGKLSVRQASSDPNAGFPPAS